MTVCTLAEMIYPARVAEHVQDMRVYEALRPWVRRCYLIVTSRGDRAHVSHAGAVVGIHVPYQQSVLLRRLQFWIVALRVGRRLVRRRNVNVLMAAEPLVGGPAALALRVMTGRPVLVHIQGDLLALPASRVGRVRAAVIRRLTMWVSRRADRVRCISRRVHQDCLDVGMAPERLRILPVRCDVEWFSPAKWTDARSAERRAAGVTDDDRLIVSVGALTVHKGHSVLIEALAAVRKTRPRVRLVLAGDGPCRDALESQIASLGLGDAVRLIGALQYARVPALLAAADVYAQPSYDEGIPRSVLEAMAMGVPVVASRVGGVPEAVEHGQTGLLVPPGDPAALADAIGRLLDDSTLARTLVATAQRHVHEQYDFTAGIRRYADLIQETAAMATA